MSKSILITGSSAGFGADIATTLAAAGHRVFATMREVDGRHREAAAALCAKGIETIELDVTDNASVDAAFATLFEKTGGTLDVLVNNAGIAAGGISEAFTPEQLRDMFEVNVFGIQRVTRAALPAMHAKKAGLIINIGSILGRVTIPFYGLYSASKHAVEALTETYRYELSQQGIDVVLIQPGPYPTQLYSSNQQPADTAREQAYGDLVNLPKGIVEFLGGVFSSADAPDPHDIAKEIATLVGTPAGERPHRVVLGLASLRTLREGGAITAASSSQIADGASAVLIASGEAVRAHGLTPLARIHTAVVTAGDPVMMLDETVNATERLLKRAGLKISDIDLYEVNEAFAPVPLSWLKMTGADPAKLNVNGGAISLGHPLGSSGTKLMTTLLYELRARGGRYGLQTMCEGGGQANAMILEAV